jgi:hypothetical protein
MSGALAPYPGYVSKPGLVQAIEAAGIAVSNVGGVLYVSDLPAAQAIAASYNPLPYLKSNPDGTGKLDLLLAYNQANFSLIAFIQNGSVTNVTGAQVSGFLANWTNNYRTLRASINAAPDQPTLAAINIATGWPSNP